uniref:Uncharacterized protein n=1 Tax=Glossina morsitans morsitans TaxID=37546 RepID=A0A1B0GEC3_GLOMM
MQKSNMCLTIIRCCMSLKWMTATLFGYLATVAFFHAGRARVDGTVLSIKYTPNEAIRVIRNHILQQLNDEFKEIARVKSNRLFYKLNPTLPFKPFSVSSFNSWEIKIVDRLMSGHTYDKVYLKMIRAIPCDVCEVCNVVESAEHRCHKFYGMRESFSFFRLYNCLLALFAAKNVRHLGELTRFIRKTNLSFRKKNTIVVLFYFQPKFATLFHLQHSTRQLHIYNYT